ncbi:flavin reductase family protein [Sphaerimonospora thailandensis]|uniref:Oxidoreductase n=1 Tax=Sphaerimonospora thailandensis TaxID=795644 RepID=A0A8J3RB77_9ACTN|nr:flavin reductase family protein [Sphaerimonospora thailandensis]GIH72487.1 oxidoreductase [Sphaerimonospora thailandensis]
MEVDLRGTMRNFATGVCIATTYADDNSGRRHDALTVNSLTSVSLGPPLVSISLRQGSTFLADLLTTKVWALSILDAGTHDLARVFAQSRDVRAEAVRTLSARPGEHTGALIVDAPAWLECELRDQFDAGDHTVLIGSVVAAGQQHRRPPIVFLHGRFHALKGEL